MTAEQAATKLQLMYRARAARTRLRLMLLDVFEKCVDPASGLHFYFNRKTGESRWEKPVLLKDGDVPGTCVRVRVCNFIVCVCVCVCACVCARA